MIQAKMKRPMMRNITSHLLPLNARCLRLQFRLWQRQ
jgi:hypothetical protein